MGHGKTLFYKEYFDEDGFLHKRWRDSDGNLHREDGPCWIICEPNGLVLFEEFYIGGIRHNINGPATIFYNEDGSIRKEIFLISGIHHTFWDFWDKLSEEERKHPNVLKCLVRYS